MKFTFRPSPNYRKTQSTTDIMRDLTFALCAVLLFSIIWYGESYGAAYALRVFLMALFAVIAAVGTEAVFFKIMKSKDIKHDVLHSYGWVTALILVLITKIDVSYYAVIIATIVAIVFGKCVFGGFGMNIFNPAAFGAAIIMNTFGTSSASSVTETVLSGATPMTAVSSAGWGSSASALSDVAAGFGGLWNMFMGNYASVIGGSCALVLICAGIFLIARHVIDWRLTVTYTVTIFVVSLIVGLMHGSGIEFAVLNVIGGGVLFGAVFMITDPVTTPVTIPGKFLFAICAACLTLVIRWKASIPDGVLFSILLMNMLTPAIDKAFDGNQIKDAGKFAKRIAIIACVAVLTAVLVGGFTLSDGTDNSTAAVAETAETAAAIPNNPSEIQ